MGVVQLLDARREIQRVLVVEDHPLIRKGLCALLDAEPDLEVVAEVGDGGDVLAQVAGHRPQAAVVGLKLRGGGLKVVRELASAAPPVPSLVLGTCTSQDSLRACLAAGASGYLLQDEAPERIVEAVRGTATGQLGWLSRDVAATLRQAWHTPLTPKELEVVGLLAKGNATCEVADTLRISTRTVRNHLNNVYSKLEVHSQPELVAWAWRTGLVG